MDSAIMSAIHASHLHGQGNKSKPRYNFSRQRVQETQKGKPDEKEKTKPTKEESAPKAARSNNGVIIILVLMIGITWGIAATSYFGVVDYKGLIDQCYDAFISEDPYEIIDKRRPVTGHAPLRQMKKGFLQKSDEPSSAAEVPPVTPETQDVGEKKEPEASKEDKPTEKERDDKPKSNKESEEKPKPKPSDGKEESGKDKEIALTLYLQLFVGNGLAVNQKHEVSEHGTVIKLDATRGIAIGSLKGQIESDSFSESEDATECTHVWNITKMSSTPATVNKLSKMAPLRHPLVPRLVLSSSAVNRKGYLSRPGNPNPIQSGPLGRNVVNLNPIPSEMPSSDDVLKPTQNHSKRKVSNKRHVPEEEVFTQRSGKIVVVLGPSGVLSDRVPTLVNSDDDSIGFYQKYCGKSCTLNLKFLNQNQVEESVDFEEEKDDFEERLSVSDFLLNKIQDLEQKLAENVEGFSSFRVALPNPVNKNFIESKVEETEYEDKVDSRIPGQRFTLPNPQNKHFLESSIFEEEEVEYSAQEDYSTVRIALPNVVNKQLSSRPDIPSRDSDESENTCERCRVTLSNTITRNLSELEFEQVSPERAISVSPYKTVVQNCQVPYKNDRPLPPKKVSNRKKQKGVTDETDKIIKEKKVAPAPSVSSKTDSESNVTPKAATSKVTKAKSSTAHDEKVGNSKTNAKHSTSINAEEKARQKHKASGTQSENGVKKSTKEHVSQTETPKVTEAKSSTSNDAKGSIETSKVQPSVKNHRPKINQPAKGRSVVRKNAQEGTPKVAKVKSNTGKKAQNKKTGAVKEEKRVISDVVSERAIKKRKNVSSRGSKNSRSSIKLVTSSVMSKAKPASGDQTLLKSRGYTGASNRHIEHFDGHRAYSTKLLFSRVISESVDPLIRQLFRYSPQKSAKKQYKWEGKGRAPRKGVKIDLSVKKTPKAKLRRMLSLAYQKSVTFSKDVITYIQNHDKLNRYAAKIQSNMPVFVKNFTKKVTSSAAYARAADFVTNTTVNDAVQFIKTNGKKGWAVIARRSSNFYQRMSNKPGVKTVSGKFSKFARKMKMKFQKFTDFVKQHIVTNRLSQKLVALFLLTLSLVGFYHVFALLFNSAF